nr:MAG TPA: Putative tail fiber protein fold, Tail fiber, receptor [Caudoviricetes sp.]
MLKKIKDWIGTNLDVYKVESANDVGAGLVRHIWKGEETATQVGTTLTAQIMNDLQKGLVHTLDTTRTVGTNKDIYEVTLTGIEEFGVFDGLKLLIRIDGENQFEDVFLKLGGTEYQIYQLKNNLLDKVDKGILKDKKEYLLNFKNNSFVLSDSTLYGSQKGTALEGNRLAEILGLEFGGNIQDIGNKTKGKFYYDSVTKYYYECIEDNSLTYNDTGKFRAISNKPISDRLEILYEKRAGFTRMGGTLIQWGYIENPSTNATLNYPVSFKEGTLPIVTIANWVNTELIVLTTQNNRFCSFRSSKAISLNWIAVGIA